MSCLALTLNSRNSGVHGLKRRTSTSSHPTPTKNNAYFSSDFASVTAIAFKDDRTFAYGDEAGALFIADLSGQAPPSVFDTRRPGINELAYSKDGLLAVAAGPGTAGEVFLFD